MAAADGADRRSALRRGAPINSRVAHRYTLPAPRQPLSPPSSTFLLTQLDVTAISLHIVSA